MKIIVFFLFIFFSTSCVEKTIKSKIQNDWEVLSGERYSIEYPSNWTLDKSGKMGTKFILFSPLTKKGDQFTENVNLIIQNLTSYKMNLDEYVKVSEKQISTIITDGNIISSERKKKNNREFQKLIYTGKQGIFNLQFEQYYWVQNNQAFILTLTCEENQFSYFKKIGEKILDSFKIINN